MKIRLADQNSFKREYVERMDFLDKEMTAEEILHVLVGKHGPLTPLEIVGDTVIVDHPNAW